MLSGEMIRKIYIQIKSFLKCQPKFELKRYKTHKNKHKKRPVLLAKLAKNKALFLEDHKIFSASLAENLEFLI